MLYCTRNEQSIVTFFSNLMQFSAYGIYRLADQQPNIILITAVTLGHTSSFWVNLSRERYLPCWILLFKSQS